MPSTVCTSAAPRTSMLQGDARTGSVPQAKVPFVARASRALFGAPSFSRAKGAADAAALPRPFKNAGWRSARRATPVYALDRRGSGQREVLPRVWVSERCFDGKTGEVEGRIFVCSYPTDHDPKGFRALELADTYYAEALQYSERSDLTTRAECFRAAEVLYLHAAGRGRTEAYLKLGLIYRGDLGDGRYWTFGLKGGSMNSSSVDTRRRAIDCFGYAACHGSGEACLRLADMLSEDGVDESEIIALIRRAFDVAGGVRHIPSSGEALISHGLAALTLARAYEGGLGVTQSFEQALGWYTYARDDLAQAFEEGAWHFKRQAVMAERGVRHMLQEIFGLW